MLRLLLTPHQLHVCSFWMALAFSFIFPKWCFGDPYIILLIMSILKVNSSTMLCHGIIVYSPFPLPPWFWLSPTQCVQTICHIPVESMLNVVIDFWLQRAFSQTTAASTPGTKNPTTTLADGETTTATTTAAPTTTEVIERRPDVACLVLDVSGSLGVSWRWAEYDFHTAAV